jgi:GH25 family lysozyme M1 (1,4-beta-N-acetylmuramidase)
MIALALLSSLSVAMATGGVDVSQRTYVDNWSCMVKNGKSFAIVRVYQSNGKPDANGKILFVLLSIP